MPPSLRSFPQRRGLLDLMMSHEDSKGPAHRVLGEPCTSSSTGTCRCQQQVELTSGAAMKIATKQQQLKPRFALGLDGLNCFETLVPR
ncbi:hypothetical protein C2845_PM16G01090 [Panicum miliaceum]|uniref:Uncharacterized protein n=1 Tax=Panicum miliaceum TaxID=4540 RepID=A0A3L6PTU2_PANMI|nr:hypothetical protein C2845_PM16G01090 [Panicum miliaceum]